VLTVCKFCLTSYRVFSLNTSSSDEFPIHSFDAIARERQWPTTPVMQLAVSRPL
jgi:hypothetical protein